MRLKTALLVSLGAAALVGGGAAAGWFLHDRRQPPPPPVRVTVRALVQTEKGDRVESWMVDGLGAPDVAYKALAGCRETFTTKKLDVVGVMVGQAGNVTGPELLLTGQENIDQTAKTVREALKTDPRFSRVVVLAGPGLETKRMAKLLGVEANP